VSAWRSLAVLVIAICVLAAACGGDSDDSNASPDSSDSGRVPSESDLTTNTSVDDPDPEYELLNISAAGCDAYGRLMSAEYSRTRIVVRSPELQQAAQQRRTVALDDLRTELGGGAGRLAISAIRDLERFPLDEVSAAGFDEEGYTSALALLRRELDPSCNARIENGRLMAINAGPLCQAYRDMAGLEEDRERILELNESFGHAADRLRVDSLAVLATSIEPHDQERLLNGVDRLTFFPFLAEAPEEDAEDDPVTNDDLDTAWNLINQAFAADCQNT
jgi:hypothetical protein